MSTTILEKEKKEIKPRDFHIDEVNKVVYIFGSKVWSMNYWCTKPQINLIIDLGGVFLADEDDEYNYGLSTTQKMKHINKIEASYAIDKLKNGYEVRLYRGKPQYVIDNYLPK